MVCTHVINISFLDATHGIFVHLWIVISNMSSTVRVVRLCITVTLTLEVCNLLDNMILTAEVVDEEVHTLSAVITSFKPFILARYVTELHHCTEIVSILKNKLVQNSRQPPVNISTSFTVHGRVLAELFSQVSNH